MEKIDRKQLAHDYFKQGYNCAQAVILAFEDVLKLDKDLLCKMSVAFGGGFGRTRNMCGAVSSMGMIIGLVGEVSDTPTTDKTDAYKSVQAVVAQFKEKNGTINCGELLKNVKQVTEGYVPQIRNAEYYNSRPCVKFVLDSVEIIENFLSEKEKIEQSKK